MKLKLKRFFIYNGILILARCYKCIYTINSILMIFLNFLLEIVTYFITSSF